MSERRRRVLRFLLLIPVRGVELAAFAVAAAWLIGRVLSDRTAWSQFLLWIPTPALLAALALGAATALLRRRCGTRAGRRRRTTRAIAWGAALLLALPAFALVEHRFLRIPPAQPSGLLVLQWTLAQPLDDAEEANLVAVVERENPDVVLVTNAGYAAWKKEIRAWLGEGRRPVGLTPFAIATRLPVRRLGYVAKTEDGVAIVAVEIDATERIGRPLLVLLVDLPSDPRIPRGALARRVRGYIDHWREESGAAAPDLVVGDFNMTRGSAAVETIAPGMRHAFLVGGHGYGATFPHEWPLWHIDQLLLAPTLDCSRYDVLPVGPARHRAQRAWILPRAE